MLYKLKAGESPFVLNEELYAIPEFKDLSEKQMVFVILTADRKSPLRTLADRDRREKSTAIAGYGREGNRPDKNSRNLISGQVPSVEKAIAKYKEYQFNEQQDSLDATNALIRTNREFINAVNSRSDVEKKDAQYGKDLKLANDFAKGLPDLEEARIKLESVLQISPEQKPEIQTYTSIDIPEEVEGSDSLSLIDQFHQQNRKNDND